MSDDTREWRCDCPPGSDPEACFCMYRTKAEGGLCDEPEPATPTRSDAALIAKLRAKLAKLELPPRFSVDAVDRGYMAALHDVVVWLDEHEKGAEG